MSRQQTDHSGGARPGPTASDARRDLERALAHGLSTDLHTPASAPDPALRRSSVLILFGSLDEIHAETPAGSTVSPDLDVLLTRRADHMRYHPGQIAFPGGGADPEDPDAVATALREAEEETGLNPSGVEVLGTLPEISLPVSSNLVTPVIGWWRSPTDVAPDRSESVEVFRVPVGELLARPNRGTSVLRREHLVHRGAAFKLSPRFGSRIVWGFTGILLASLFDGLGWTTPWDPEQEFVVTG